MSKGSVCTISNYSPLSSAAYNSDSSESKVGQSRLFHTRTARKGWEDF